MRKIYRTELKIDILVLIARKTSMEKEKHFLRNCKINILPYSNDDVLLLNYRPTMINLITSLVFENGYSTKQGEPYETPHNNMVVL